MFYNAIRIGIILKHASHTLLELLQYRCKTKTCSCNPDHPPHLSSLGRHFRPLTFHDLHAFCCFEDIRSKIYNKENSLRVYWAPNMQIVRSRGMIFMALKSILYK
jgi:hypothetical protein